MKPYVIAFEGLFSFWPFGQFVRKGLLEPLHKELNGSFDYKVYSWAWPWVSIPKDRKVYSLGHSFGGKRAIEFANKHLDKISVVVSLDPRMQPEPVSKIVRSYNFFQRGSFHGFQVPRCASETELNCSHTAVPRQKEVHELMRRLIKGEA